MGRWGGDIKDFWGGLGWIWKFWELWFFLMILNLLLDRMNYV